MVAPVAASVTVIVLPATPVALALVVVEGAVDEPAVAPEPPLIVSDTASPVIGLVPHALVKVTRLA